MRFAGTLNGLAIATALAVAGHGSLAADSARTRSALYPLEDYLAEPMPPGFQVLNNELEGNVFADASGHTLYTWRFRQLRRGEAGDQVGESTCTNVRVTINGGFAEPYPEGLILPNAENRPTCVDVWPPVYAGADAKPVGKWSIITRKDGAKQWAYGGQALYTSVRDKAPGDVLASSRRGRGGGGRGGRTIVGPASNIPPGFSIVQTVTGRVLVNDQGRSVYTFDGDAPNKSTCNADCLKDWTPMEAPALAESRGEFTVFERVPGTKQWAFRGKPLYTYVLDPEGQDASFIGSDVPGWRNVYTQRVRPIPSDFTVQDSPAGVILADSRGMAVYVYNCTEDSQDQLACDHPEAPQDYRFAICGGGDPDKCVQTFPYVLASRGAKSESRLWTVMTIDPKTGRRGTSGQPGTLDVWAYRDRPVYTFVGDKVPGDRFANGFGEGSGSRNGFTSLILRDDYFDNDQ